MTTITRPTVPVPHQVPDPVRAPVALPLPFDDEGDAAIPFVLTAAAHREVLGRDVPPLAAVPAAPEEPEPDTRRLQARALLRSGMPVTTIAAALGVATACVEEWTGDLEDELARRRRSSRGPRAADPLRRPAPGTHAVATSPEGRERLVAGLAFALADVHEDGVTVTHDRLEPVAVLLDALRERRGPLALRIRVAVRLAPDLAADRVRVEVARRLGVDAGTVLTGRAGPDVQRGFELRVDVQDASAAALVRAWQDGTSSADLVEQGTGTWT